MTPLIYKAPYPTVFVYMGTNISLISSERINITTYSNGIFKILSTSVRSVSDRRIFLFPSCI